MGQEKNLKDGLKSWGVWFPVFLISFLPPILFIGIIVASEYLDYLASNGIFTDMDGNKYPSSFFHYVFGNVGTFTFILMVSFFWILLAFPTAITFLLSKKDYLKEFYKKLAIFLGTFLSLLLVPILLSLILRVISK